MSSRYNLFPIVDEESYKFFKRQEVMMWSANEMDFIRDRHDFEKLTPRQRRTIEWILGFFAPGDGLVSKNLVFRFLKECENYEESLFFVAQLFIEAIHSETYGLMIMTLIRDEKRRNEIFELATNHPVMKAKVEWMEKYIESGDSKATRFLAFACAEGLFFSVLFAVIFYFRSLGKMQTLTFSNEQISKDEALHRDYGCYMYNKHKTSADTREKAIEIITSAIDVERPFIQVMLGREVGEETDTSLGDLNEERMELYLKSIANNLLQTLGYESNPEWEKPNPFTWMNDISLLQKSNQFELRSGNYTKSSLVESFLWKKRVGLIETKEVDFSDPTSIDF